MWEVPISEMGWLGPILDTKLISVVLCFTATIAVQINYWSIKNKTKWFSNNLNIWFALKSIHITLEVTRGVNSRSWIRPYGKTAKISPPGKFENCLIHNTNMFFQPMSDIFTLNMGLLVHSWFEIMELVRF